MLVAMSWWAAGVVLPECFPALYVLAMLALRPLRFFLFVTGAVALATE